MPNQQNNPTDKVLFIGLTVFLLTVVVYHTILRPLWVESFGAVEIPVCNQMVLTLPGKIPRSFQGDNVLPDRAAVIRGDWAFHVTLMQGGQALSMEGGKEYYVWVPPDYPWDKVFIDISGEAECHRSLSVRVESKTDYLAKRIAALLLGLPFATLLALISLLWKVYQYREQRFEEAKAQQRAREEQEQTERLLRLQSSLESLSPSEQALRYYQTWRQHAIKPTKLEHWWRTYILHFAPYEKTAIRRTILAQIWLPSWQDLTPNCEKLKELHHSGLLSTNDFTHLKEHYCPLPSPANFSLLIRFLGLHPQLVTLLSQYYAEHPHELPAAIQRWKGEEGKEESKDKDKDKNQDDKSKENQKVPKHIGFALGQSIFSTIHDKLDASQQAEVRKILDNPPLHRPRPAHLALWSAPTSPPSCLYWTLQKSRGPSRAFPSPFGPTKAENDPRLPLLTPANLTPSPSTALGLFWEASPLWQKVLSPTPTWFLTNPGCGTTALIWMARHHYRYWGSKGPALSLYFPLEGPASARTCTQLAQGALARTILANLAEDPTWFLGIPHTSWQKDILRLLYAHYDSAERILGRLTPLSASQEDDTLQILEEQIRSHAPQQHALPLLWENLEDILSIVRLSMSNFGSRAGKHASLPVILLVEARIQPEGTPTKWIARLTANCPLWRWGIVKVFAPHKPSAKIPIPIEPCQWTQNDLIKMLTHRLETIARFVTAGKNPPWKSRLLSSFWKALISSSQPSSEPPADWNALAAQIFYAADMPTTPKALIQWGNQQAQSKGLCASKTSK